MRKTTNHDNFTVTAFKNCVDVIENSGRPLLTGEEKAVATIIEYEQAGYAVDKNTRLSELCNKQFGTSFSEEDAFAVLEAAVYESYGELNLDFDMPVSLNEIKQKLESFKNERRDDEAVEALVRAEQDRENQKGLEYQC